MLPVPAINYMLLGEAVRHYVDLGYTYVEAPWTASDELMAATYNGPTKVQVHETHHGQSIEIDNLVASSEQSLLGLNLVPGRYVACTPCFRVEDVHTYLTRPYFMKVELFDNLREKTLLDMVGEAKAFMQAHTTLLVVERLTTIGIDLNVVGYEVGSYGERETRDGSQQWIYGTGLALPRFTAAIETVAAVRESLSRYKLEGGFAS